LDWGVFSGAFLLFITNLAGIVLAAAATFFVMGFSSFHVAKKGMMVSLLFVAMVSIPLVLSYNKMVKEQVKSPLIVGGGLKTEGDLKTAWKSGADLVIIGTAFEQNPAILKLY